MPNLSTLKTGPLYAMFKGEPGTRKSTAALSFPTPQYWISTDQKMNALILPGKKWNTDFSQIDYDDFKDFNGPEAKLKSFQLNCKYKTIIIDSVTSVGDNINRQIINLKSGTTGKSGEEKGMRIGGIPVNTLDDYKGENAAFNSLLAITKDINKHHGCNIILIAHVIGNRNSEQTAGITHFARTIITGGKAISGKLPAYCDETYHFNVQKSVDPNGPGEYGLYTVHTGDDFARTALPLPSYIKFDDKPLYQTFLLPAIEQLNGGIPTTK